MDTWPGRTGTKSRTVPVIVSYSRRSVTTGQLTGLFSVDHQSGRDGGQSFAASRQTEAVGGRRRHRDRSVEQLREHLLRIGAPRADLRPVPNHLYGRVSDPISRLTDQVVHV